MVDPDLLRRQLILLSEANSAVAQCTLALGSKLTDQIIGDIEAARQNITAELQSQGQLQK